VGWHAAKSGSARTARCIDRARMAKTLVPLRGVRQPLRVHLPRKMASRFS
jgi:hypothetical protein